MRWSISLFNPIPCPAAFRGIFRGTRFLGLLWGAAVGGSVMASEEANPVLEEEEAERRNLVGFSVGGGFGTFIFGGKIRHDFAFFNVHYGYIFAPRIAEETFLAGRVTILGEFTVGREIRPGDAWALSLTPILRYQFDRSETVVPFIEAGSGLTWTDIRVPDLGGDLQFNPQAGAGLYWFASSDFAYTIQYRFVHYSNAGLRSPNSGVNMHAGLFGVSYFF